MSPLSNFAGKRHSREGGTIEANDQLLQVSKTPDSRYFLPFFFSYSQDKICSKGTAAQSKKYG
jgi:hypothetical protein